MMRIVLVAILILMTAAFGVIGYGAWRGSQPEAVAFGAPFTLLDQDGQPITEAAFQDRPTALFFGFTHCPEVCPTTLFEMDGWLSQLGEEGRELQAFFVTVDPERDTPETMKIYLENFSQRIKGITGEPDKVMAMTRDFRIFARKVELENGDYTMDHTASILLLDRDGDFFGTISYEENADAALAKLRRLIKEG